MTATITSLVLSIVAVVCMLVAIKDGLLFDTKLLVLVIISVGATICSWLARIEASIDKKEFP